MLCAELIFRNKNFLSLKFKKNSDLKNFFLFIKQYAKAEEDSLIFQILDKAEVTFRNIMDPVRNSLSNRYFGLQKDGAKIESEIREYTQNVLDTVSFIL